MQEEHYRRQAEHYRLQAEYYEQKDKFYRQEIERMRKHNLQQSSHSSDKMQPGSQTLPAVHSPKFTTLTIVDPNTADSATLCSIPGIARGIAGSIIRQRQRLGGFYDVAQLLECQYFSEDLLPWFAIADKPALKKISINKATFYHLVRHPYISKAQTQDILRYIRIYGPIQDSTQLSSTGIFTSEELSRLLPYLEF
jgi:DNA uptake protein ComE-like DNA-binding protein